MRIHLKSALFLALSLVSLAEPLRAETGKADSTETVLKTHNLGFGAGFLSGYGLTYRHWYPTRNGYQVTFIPVARIDDQGTYFNTSLGAIGLRSLHETRHSNFFGYYGGHYNFTLDEATRQNYFNNATSDYQYEQVLHNVYAGAGMGFEVHFWNLNASLMFGYAANARTERVDDPYYDSYNQVTNPDSGKWRNSFQFQPSIEGALFYSF